MKKQEAFIRTIDKGQFSHAYLFEGAKGIGKAEVAKEIAKILNCTNRNVGEGSCQVCEHCLRIEHGNFPDYIVVEPEGTTIKVDQIRSLKTQLTKTAMESSVIICVIHAVDTLTPGAANSLLKFLEEPTGNIHFILLKSNLSKYSRAFSHTSFSILSPKGVSSPAFSRSSVKVNAPPSLE